MCNIWHLHHRFSRLDSKLESSSLSPCPSIMVTFDGRRCPTGGVKTGCAFSYVGLKSQQQLILNAHHASSWQLGMLARSNIRYEQARRDGTDCRGNSIPSSFELHQAKRVLRKPNVCFVLGNASAARQALAELPQVIPCRRHSPMRFWVDNGQWPIATGRVAGRPPTSLLASPNRVPPRFV